MTWHLKDRELEKKLNELSKGEFSKNLHEFDEDIFASCFGKTIRIKNYSYCTEGGDDEPIIERIPKFGFYFTKDELEEVPEYNPKIWNDSRKVTPPEDVIFMAKVYRTNLCEETRVYYKSLIYKDSNWYFVINGKPSCTQVYLYEGDYVEFKSWED